MEKIDAVVETICATGVIVAPFWLAYKVILCIFN